MKDRRIATTGRSWRGGDYWRDEWRSWRRGEYCRRDEWRSWPGATPTYIWDSVQLSHPYDTSSKFPEQAKEK